MTNDLELADLRRVKREGTLDAHAEGNLADGERLTGGATAHADDVALEHLDALAVALLDAVVHLHVVARDDRGDVLTNLLTLDGANVIHAAFLVSLSRGPDAAANGTWSLHTSEQYTVSDSPPQGQDWHHPKCTA